MSSIMQGRQGEYKKVEWETRTGRVSFSCGRLWVKRICGPNNFRSSTQMSYKIRSHTHPHKYTQIYTHFVVFVWNKNTANAINRHNKNKLSEFLYHCLTAWKEGRERKREMGRGARGGYAKQMGSFAGTREANKGVGCVWKFQ